MVKSHLQDVRAKVIPISLCVEKVQMPCFVDDRGRADLMPGYFGNKEKFGVFVHDSLGKSRSPTIFLNETGQELGLTAKTRKMSADLLIQRLMLRR